MESGSSQPEAPRGLRFDSPSAGRISYRRTRIRLMLLVFCLGGVLLAMRAAGNPRNWAWLTEAGKPQVREPLELTEIHPPTESSSASSSGRESDGEHLYTYDDPPSNQDVANAEGPPQLRSDQQLDDLDLDFWRRFVSRLDRPSQRNFYRLVFPSSTGESQPVAESIENLVTRLRGFYQTYTAELLAQAGVFGTADSPTRQAAYDLLFDWQQQWRDEIEPRLAAWTQATPQPRALSPGLPDILARVAQLLVQDRTSIPAAADHLFVQQLLDRTVDLTPAQSAAALPVTHVQLTNQPADYRGRLVSFAGRIRAARQLPTGRERQGLVFYEWWVQPSDGATIPFCVLTTNWPSSLPLPGTTLQSLDQQAQFVAYFYKVRAYQATEGRIQFCPTLFGPSPQLETGTAQLSAPPAWWWLPLLTFVGVCCAVGVATWVYRSSNAIGSRNRRPAASVGSWPGPVVETVENRLSPSSDSVASLAREVVENGEVSSPSDPPSPRALERTD